MPGPFGLAGSASPTSSSSSRSTTARHGRSCAGRRPPAGVAQQAGFFDQSHLHRHFRATLGMTPGRYAELARSDVQDARAIAA
jgi:AraC-like DNA-binding protein